MRMLLYIYELTEPINKSINEQPKEDTKKKNSFFAVCFAQCHFHSEECFQNILLILFFVVEVKYTHTQYSYGCHLKKNIYKRM